MEAALKIMWNFNKLNWFTYIIKTIFYNLFYLLHTSINNFIDFITNSQNGQKIISVNMSKSLDGCS